MSKVIDIVHGPVPADSTLWIGGRKIALVGLKNDITYWDSSKQEAVHQQCKSHAEAVGAAVILYIDGVFDVRPCAACLHVESCLSVKDDVQADSCCRHWAEGSTRPASAECLCQGAPFEPEADDYSFECPAHGHLAGL